MNGLTSGISSIVLLVLSFISYQYGEIFMTMIFLSMAGSILGFWRYNFFKGHPFMGDNGSMFIGYLIAVLTIIATYYKKGIPTSLPVLMPVVILGVPLFDTITVIWLRLKRGAPIMQGDTNHFSHRLVALGMNKKQSVLFIYLLTFCVAINGILLVYLPYKGSILLGIQTFMIFMLIYILERVSVSKNTNMKIIEENKNKIENKTKSEL
jgi:UDP-GlcNAc:undecaprenyl-phosphate GlcNAc-1-phosphate transferase